MTRHPALLACFCCFLFAQASRGQCLQGHDYRSTQSSGWLIADLKITGTHAVGSDALATMASELIGMCMNEDSEELRERIRILFQDRGFYAAHVSGVQTESMDPLARPKPVTVEAEVAEGVLAWLDQIRFAGNHAINEEALRNGFPLKKGDVFRRDKIGSGLENLRKLYVSNGFLDFSAMVNTNEHGDRVSLELRITEGMQYHMGKLDVPAKKELAEVLRERWELAEGAVFDRSYIEKYLDANRTLLPQDMRPDRVQVVRNCPNATVEVRVLVDTVIAASGPQPKEVKCSDAGAPDR